MFDKKTSQLLQLYFRESERVRLLELEDLPELGGDELAAMQLWLSSKRNFTQEEVLQQHWLKTCSAGQVMELILHPDGSLDELSLFNRACGKGKWALNDGVLEIEIARGEDDYRCTVFANKNINIHSAIEYKNGQLHSYLKLAQTRPVVF